jgi:diguanylate cyclase (GGDEF)-like protein/PAS domain S-box-containing protein
MSWLVRILMVTMSSEDSNLLINQLSGCGYEVQSECLDSVEGLSDSLKSRDWDLVLVSHSATHLRPVGEVITVIKEKCPDLPCAVLSPVDCQEEALEFERTGVGVYLWKDNLVALVQVIERALAKKGIIQEEKTLRSALQQTERRYRSLVELSPDGIVVHRQGIVVYCNPSAVRLFGANHLDDLIGKSVLEYVHPDYREVVRQRIKKMYDDGQPAEIIEEKLLRMDGRIINVEVLAVPVLFDGDQLIQLVIHDITDRKQVEESLHLTNLELSQNVNELKQRNREALWFNEMGNLFQSCIRVEEAYAVFQQYVTKFFPEKAGALYSYNKQLNLMESVVNWGDNLDSELVFTPEDCWGLRRGQAYHVTDLQRDITCNHVNANPATCYICVPMIAQGETMGLLYIQYDSNQAFGRCESLSVLMAEHMALALSNLRLREYLGQESSWDELTGLYNRRFMEDMLEREIHRAMHHHRSLGIAMMDIDHLKDINSTHGKEVGDEVLRTVARYLQASIRHEDIACRLEEDHFLVIFPEFAIGEIQNWAQQFMKNITGLEFRYLSETAQTVKLSVGLAGFPENGRSSTLLISAAVNALKYARNPIKIE